MLGVLARGVLLTRTFDFRTGRVGVLYALLTGFCGYVLLAASYLSYEILGGGAVADAVVICVEIKFTARSS